MKNLLFVFLLIATSGQMMAIELSADLFTYDEAKVEREFAELTALETYIKSNSEISNTSIDIVYPVFQNELNQLNNAFNSLDIAAPGKVPSFWFCFTLSAIGTYTLYGAVAGPIAVGIVYFSTDKDKTEVKKALWGCLTGTLVGAGIKYAVLNL